MTHEFEYMLQLVAVGACGHPLRMDCTDAEWNKVIAAAKAQKVDCYLAYGLKRNRALSCPPELRDPLIRDSRALMVSNALHRSAIIRLLQDMETAGIHAVLLKGYAISGCYHIPEYRTCADADIWVNPKEEKRACAFLESQGFTVRPRWKNGHHAVCKHPMLGCVELHVILYDEIIEDIWFKMDSSEFVTEPHIPVHTEDGSYYTLGYTDHLIFLVLHMIKHFIEAGLSVQMMLDVALFYQKNAYRIDSDRLWRTVSSLRYGTLLQSILWAMILHCGFRPEDFPGICPDAPEQVTAILDDLEAGGWLGKNDMREREQGWYAYNRQIMISDKSKAYYWKYMLKWKLDLYCNALFPKAELLEEKYPYIRSKPFLIPFAWLHRIIFRGFRKIGRKTIPSYTITDESKVSTAGQARIQLFRSLDMIE